MSKCDICDRESNTVRTYEDAASVGACCMKQLCGHPRVMWDEELEECLRCALDKLQRDYTIIAQDIAVLEDRIAQNEAAAGFTEPVK